MSEQPSGSPASTAAPDPQSVEGVFLAALAHASRADREAFVQEACGDDAERRRRVEALLRAYEDAGSFLEHPPATPGEASFNLDFLTPSDDPSLLGLLGQYEVYEVLGRGGMGIVFRARDPKLNRVVAIKVLAPELAANPTARRRFLREAQAAAAISHPHVVTIHAVDEGVESQSKHSTLNSQHSTLPYLVMECIVGQTLQQKLDKQGSLRLTEILRIGHQLACGLAAAHKQGLIHRDIKPANILLENGVERVKITDFGLARLVDDVSITRTGEVSGTPQYMSPEQAAGDPVDHRSDLFSLGCVLYAMCTGRSPFRATSLAAAIRRVCDDTPRPIEEINPEIPAWLSDFINQLLEKNPDARIQSTEEVATFLGDRLAGLQLPSASLKPARAIASQPIPVRATQPESKIPSDARVGRALIFAGLGFLVIPWIAAAAYRLIEGNAWPMAQGGGPFVTTALGLLCMVAGWTITRVFGAPADDLRDRPISRRRERMGQWSILVGSLLIGGVIVAFAYVAAGFPDLPPFEGRDFGTITIPIFLLGAWLALTGLFLKGRFIGHSQFVDHRRVRRERDIRRIGRTAIWAGVAVMALPWLPMAFGFIVGDGDPMEFGGMLILPAVILGFVVILMGCITLLVDYAVSHSQSSRDVSPVRSPITARVTEKSPWTIIGWMIVSGMVVIPLALAALIGFYVSMEQRHDARRQQRARERPAQSDVDEQKTEAQPLEIRRQREEMQRQMIQRRRDWIAAATATFRFDASDLGDVGLIVKRADAVPVALPERVGLGEILIRAGDQSSYDAFQSTGTSEVRLPPGEYEIFAYGRVFGWPQMTLQQSMDVGGGMMGMVGGMMMGMGIPDDEGRGMGMMGDEFGGMGAVGPLDGPAISKVGQVTVDELSTAEPVKLTYDWQDIAARPPKATGQPTRYFYWNNAAYPFNRAQAQLVQRLLTAFAVDTPDVPKSVLIVEYSDDGGPDPADEFGFAARNPDDFTRLWAPDASMMGMQGVQGAPPPRSIEQVFQFAGRRHPAWGTLIIPGATEDTYRLAEPIIPPPAIGASPSTTADPFAGPGGLPEGIDRTTAPAEATERAAASATPAPGDRIGYLNIDIRDDGLIVALRRKSAFGGFVPGSEKQVSGFGVTHLKLAPGEYEVLIRDTQCGWGNRIETVAVGREVKELVVNRDFMQLARPSEPSQGSATIFRWEGQEFRLPYMAEQVIVGELAKAFAAGQPEVNEESLLDSIPPYPPGPHPLGWSIGLPLPKSPESLADVFNLGDELTKRSTPIVGNLIVPGETPGTYRLKPLPYGTLNVDIRDPGMSVSIAPIDVSSDVSPRELGPHGDLQRDMMLPAGEYQIVVNDLRAGWMALQGFALPKIPARTETITLRAGETLAYPVKRDLADLLSFSRSDYGIKSDEPVAFLWPIYPMPKPLEWSHRRRPQVILSQEKCIKVLIEAFLDGRPEVAEAELLEKAEVDATSFAEVFPPSYGGPNAWETTIVPGETPGTWRLKPLSDVTEPHEADDSTSEGPNAIDTELKASDPDLGDVLPPAPSLPIDADGA